MAVNPYMKKVYVARTMDTGRGIFAKTDIKKNEKIFVVKGKVIKDHYGFKGKNYGSKGKYLGDRWLIIGKRTWISPFRSNPYWFINHSCNPNAGSRGKVTILAMKGIKKDEGITIDYSTTEEDPYWRMKCNCGSKNCRKIIRSVQFLPEEIFKRYKPYIPKYLQRFYVNSHNPNLQPNEI